MAEYHGGTTRLLCTIPTNQQQITPAYFRRMVRAAGGVSKSAALLQVSQSSIRRWMLGNGAPNPTEMDRIIWLAVREAIARGRT